MEINRIYNIDCFDGFRQLDKNSVDMVLTDIPYGVVNRDNSRIRNFDKGRADIVGFDLQELTKTLCDITKGSIYMFCGTEQLSDIRRIMVEKKMSTRVIVWEKSNPSPMNGEFLWLSGIELCVFGKKGGESSILDVIILY